MNMHASYVYGVCICLCVCAYVRACMRVCVCVCVCVHSCQCIHAFVCVCACVCVCVCVCVCTCTYVPVCLLVGNFASSDLRSHQVYSELCRAELNHHNHQTSLHTTVRCTTTQHLVYHKSGNIYWDKFSSF